MINVCQQRFLVNGVVTIRSRTSDDKLFQQNSSAREPDRSYFFQFMLNFWDRLGFLLVLPMIKHSKQGDDFHHLSTFLSPMSQVQHLPINRHWLKTGTVRRRSTTLVMFYSASTTFSTQGLCTFLTQQKMDSKGTRIFPSRQVRDIQYFKRLFMSSGDWRNDANSCFTFASK